MHMMHMFEKLSDTQAVTKYAIVNINRWSICRYGGHSVLMFHGSIM